MSGVTGFPNGETVTIVRPGTVTGHDIYGNDTRGPDTETDVAGCAVAPAGTSENVEARDQVQTGLTVWLPAGTQIRPTDQLRIRGDLYEVDAQPSSWSSPFTGFAGPVQVTATRVTG